MTRRSPRRRSIFGRATASVLVLVATLGLVPGDASAGSVPVEPAPAVGTEEPPTTTTPEVAPDSSVATTAPAPPTTIAATAPAPTTTTVVIDPTTTTTASPPPSASPPSTTSDTTVAEPPPVTVGDPAQTPPPRPPAEQAPTEWAPAWSVIKEAPTPSALIGDDADFRITVANGSDTVTLRNVRLDDDRTPDCATTLPDIGPGAVQVVDCTAFSVADLDDNVRDDTFTNVVEVVADVDTPDSEATVTDVTIGVDEASVALEYPAPTVDVTKTAVTPSVPAGGDAVFEITATNTSSQPLYIDIDDPLVPDCSGPLGYVTPGSARTVSCDADDVRDLDDDVGDGAFTNEATARGCVSPGCDEPVLATDTATVELVGSGGLRVVKTAEETDIQEGEDVSYTITVTNTGDVPVYGVVVDDPNTPDCASEIGTTLSASGSEGAQFSYECIADVVSDGDDGTVDGLFVNVATATGCFTTFCTDVSGTDNAIVRVAAAEDDIAVFKTPLSDGIDPGDDASFVVEVYNDRDEALTGIDIVDPLSPDCDRSELDDLDPYGSVFYTCDATAVQDLDDGVSDDRFTNTVTVTGCALDDIELGCLLSVELSASGSVPLTGPPAPELQITKTALDPDAVEGDDVDFRITVTNPGNVDLSDIVITDDLAPDCARTDVFIAAGDDYSYRCTLEGVADELDDVDDGQFTNVATASWYDESSCDFEFAGSGNLAPRSAAGTEGAVDTCLLEASDSAVVTVTDAEPDIEIVKTATTPVIFERDDIEYEITVTNTGNVKLMPVTVTDPYAGDCDATIEWLAPAGSDGDTVAYSCSASYVSDSRADVNDGIDDDLFTNEATVVGCSRTTVGEEGMICVSQVEDVDSAPVELVERNAELSITKTALVDEILAGEDVPFEIVITNTGDYSVFDLAVLDDRAPDCAGPVTLPGETDELDPDDSVTITCTAFSVNDGDDDTVDGLFTNIATAEGAYDDCGECFDTIASEPSSDSVVVTPREPGITIEKTAIDDAVLSGEDARFRIQVTNTGDADLYDVSVSDELATDCERSELSLAAGADLTYTCTALGVDDLDDAVADDRFTNLAAASGFAEDPDCYLDTESGSGAEDVYSCDEEVTDEDTASVLIARPAVDITKTALDASVASGGDATFVLTVTNVGNVRLSSLQVADPRTPNCVRNALALNPGQTLGYTCVAAGVTDQADQLTDGRFTNVAQVTGSYRGLALSSQATDDVDVIDPPQPAPPGESPPPSFVPPLPPEEPPILPIVVFETPSSPPPPSAAVDPPSEEENAPADPTVTLITGDDTTVVTGATIELAGEAPDCALNVLIDGEPVAVSDDDSSPTSFSFQAPTTGLSAGRHVARVECADGTGVYERPFTLVNSLANNGGGTGAMAFLVVLIMLLGWRFLFSSGTNQEQVSS